MGGKHTVAPGTYSGTSTSDQLYKILMLKNLMGQRSLLGEKALEDINVKEQTQRTRGIAESEKLYQTDVEAESGIPFSEARPIYAKAESEYPVGSEISVTSPKRPGFFARTFRGEEATPGGVSIDPKVREGRQARLRGLTGEARAAAVEEARARYGDEFAAEIARRPDLVPSSKLTDVYEKEFKAKGEASKAKKEEAEAGIKTEEAKTYSTFRSAQVRREEAGASAEETKAKYAPHLADLEMQLKQAQINKDEAETNKINLEIKKAQREAANAKRIDDLRDGYQKEVDPNRKQGMLREIAVLNGHEVGVLEARPKALNEYARLTMSTEAREVEASLPAAFKTNDPTRIAMEVDRYNRGNFAAGQVIESTTTNLVGVGREEGITGTSYKMSRSTVSTPTARMYINGDLQRAAMGKGGEYVDIDGQVKSVSSAQALAKLAAIDQAYVGRPQDNPRPYLDYINKFPASPEVKAQATAIIEKSISDVTPKIAPEVQDPEAKRIEGIKDPFAKDRARLQQGYEKLKKYVPEVPRGLGGIATE